MTAPSSNPPAGFYDYQGRHRWWDGTQWAEHYQVAPQAQTAGPMTAADLNVKREVVYTREQKGHSLILYIFLSLIVIGIPGLIYYTVSPNHFWTA
jgi:hypothetical protein